MKEKCRKGHRLNEKTVYLRPGNSAVCRLCRSEAAKRRYQADEVFRERVKDQALARYHRLAKEMACREIMV